MSLAAVMPPEVGQRPDPGQRPVISFHGVSKTYANGTEAIRDVDLAIYLGDFCFVVGASGSGKTTLVRLLIREEAASSGRIFIDGHETTRMSRRRLPKLRRKFGIVFQDYKLLPKLTVAQNVAFALQVTRPGQRHMKEKVEETLWIVGLEDKLTKFPDELSGGEQQRVAIARALVHRPAHLPRRRAHRQPRPRHLVGDRAAAAPDQPPRHHGADGHPQPRDRRPLPEKGDRHQLRPGGPRRGRGRLPPRGRGHHMRGLLASVRFALVAAGQNFTRNLAVSMAGVFTMGLIMLLVGGTILLTHTVDAILNQQEAQADEIHIYLQDSLPMRTIADYEQRFAHDARVNGVGFTTKDQAVILAQQRGLQLQSAINTLGSNPLPASIDLHVRNLNDLTQLNTLAKSLPIVDTSSGSATDYSPHVIPVLKTVITWTVWVGAILAIVLGVISLVIIMNTIRTAVYIRRTEIEIMKLVGASDWFVRWPFILEGVFGGVLAAAFGATIVALAYRFVLDQANTQAFLGVSFDGPFLTALVVLLVVFGAALGGFGSFLGIRRFLHV